MANKTYTWTADQRIYRFIVDEDILTDIPTLWQQAVIAFGSMWIAQAGVTRFVELGTQGSNSVTTAYSSRHTLGFPFSIDLLESYGYTLSIVNNESPNTVYYVCVPSDFSGSLEGPKGTTNFYPVCPDGSTSPTRFRGGSDHAGEDHAVIFTISKLSGCTITQYLTECTSSYSGSFERVGTSLVITLTANTNYQFESGSVYATYGTVSISADKSTAIITVTTTAEDLDIHATATTSLETVDVIEHLTRCTSDAPATGLETTAFTINFTPVQREGQTALTRIKSIVTNYGTVSIAENRLSATLTGTFTDYDLEYTVICADAYILSLGTLQNATINPPIGGFIWESGNDRITITGTDELIRFYSENDSTHNYSYLVTQSATYYPIQYRFIVADDGNSAYIDNLTIEYRIGAYNVIYVNAYGYSIAVPSRLLAKLGAYSLYCFYNMYELTDTQLTVQSIMRDADCIPGVIQFYVSHIQPDLTGNSRVISIFNDQGTRTQAVPYVNEYIKTVSCGSIDLTGEYNNALDYRAVINLVLPFIGIVPLDTSKVMNKSISLVYIADYITCKCAAVIYANNVVIDTKEGMFCEKFETRARTNLIGDLVIDSSVFYGYIPYITIQQADAINYDLHDTFEYGKIGDFSGYNRFANIRLISKCNNDVFNDIISKLESGVIINEP